ncbi:MAG: hypothetical protein GX434_03475 [Peptococcaceae bacterium]|nr:hypothetical protein [Peptococcaceae bacterium]
MNITERILPPDFQLEGNLLTIRPPAPYSIDFICFKPDMTSTQFVKDTTPNPFSYPTIFGRQAVYLIIPKDMEINTNAGNIIYVNPS